MLNRVLCCVILSTVAGPVFSHTLPLPHEKPPEWEQPVVISEEFFPPHSRPHHPPHLPQNEFKEIIGIELQRIPFHGGPEHEILEHKEHEVLQHRKHQVLEHGHEFLKPHVHPEILEQEHREHEILPHEISPPAVLEHELEHGHHDFHNILENEHEEVEHREHERRDHEIMTHEHPHDHDHDIHHEHDVSAHHLPHERPPWEDPDFVLSEEEHQHEHEHEFHHEELFPEVYRRRNNRRRDENSREGGSRRNNSNSNRRGNSNRRENSNRQGNNNRGNSNRENSRRNREGSNINTEELFPRRNRQNNNRRNNNNNNNNRRNNREGSRRNSNIEELSALEEEILHDPEVSDHEISRPERDVGSFFNNDRRETTVYEFTPSQQSGSIFQTNGFSTIQSSSQPINSFETYRPSGSFVSDSFGTSQTFTNGQSFGNSGQQRPAHSNLNNQEFSSSGFLSSSNVNEYSFSSSNSRIPDRPSSNIFVKEEEYLTLESPNLQQTGSRPTGSVFNSNGQSLGTQGLTGSSRPGQSSSFGSNRPQEFNTGESSRPSYLGSRPGSGKPLLPSQESSRPNRPGSGSSGSLSQNGQRPGRPSSSSSGFNSYQEERPGRPSSSSSGFNSYQEERPGRPSGSSSGFNSYQEERPGRPSGSSSGFNSYQEERPGRPSGSSSGFNSYQEERPGRPSSSSSGFNSYQEERPGRPSSSSSGFNSYQEERPGRPSSSSSGFNSYQEERPGRPSTGSSGSFSQKQRPGRPSGSSSEFQSYQEERPGRPSSSSSGHSSNQGNSKPNRPTNSYSNSHEENSRPQRPGSKPTEGNSNGNNLINPSELISVQEDSWLWPGQLEDEDRKNRRAYSSGNKKPSTTTKRPTTSGSSSHNNSNNNNKNNKKKQHANIKLLPTDTCGVDLGNKIIGGENTQLDEFPWMALLQHSSVDGRALGFGCGGSLISPRYVLTAAHCIKGPAIGNNIRVTKVRLGEFDVSSDVDCQGEICSSPPVDVAVEEIIVHPKYRSTDRAQLNDIALIRLRENVKNSAYISPICLPLNGNNDHVGERLTVAGWGRTSNGQNGTSSKTKQKVSVPVVTLKECSPFYNGLNIHLDNTQMCAGGERGKDSCLGDSGGPLMGSEVIDSQIRWQVHGIVSFGPEKCGADNIAGVYTKVSEYTDWILDNMKK